MAVAPIVRALLDRGAIVPAPESVFVGAEVDPERIAPGVTLHPGCRITGSATWLGPQAAVGEEQPAVLHDCRLAARAAFRGGYGSRSVLLDGAAVGSAAHVRPGCILEEESSCAHAVGLKQTILFPFVTLGSLINFCDCLMAGGTGPKDHGEVGSSYIHFNFTARQDKATPSLLGDVPRGVMLDQPPIFLGGQGGLVGPAAIAFGTTIAAGTVFRGSVTEPGQLVFGQAPRRGVTRYDPRLYGEIGGIVAANLNYIGNLFALREWYRHVRLPRAADPFSRACVDGALDCLRAVLAERRKRLGELAEKVGESLRIASAEYGRDLNAPVHTAQRRFAAGWPALAERLDPGAEFAGDVALRDAFLDAASRCPAGGGYVAAIRALPPEARAAGTAWLNSVVAAVTSAA